MRRRRSLLLAALAVALPACSLGPDAPAALVPPAPGPGVKAGGELRVGIVRPATIDPQLLDPSDTAAALVVRTMCDPLVGADPSSRELRPGLAKAWRVLGEGTSVQVELKEGLRFSDGTPLAARDVVATFQRVVDPATVSPAARLVEKVAGYDDVRADKIEPQALYGVRAVSGDTVQVELTRGDAQWVNALTLPFAIPFPRDAASKPGFSASPVCVGPYRVAAPYTGSENEIRLVRVAGYEGTLPALTRAGAGWADRVTFRIYASRADALKGLRAGEVDAAQAPSTQVPPGSLSVPTGRLEYVGLPRVAPFDDPGVKAALTLALDRERLNAVAFRGTREPARNLFPVTLPDSLLPDPRVVTCGTPPTGDVATARKVLAERRVDLSRVRVPFYVNDEFDNAAMVAELGRQWKAAFGLTLVPRKVPFEQLLARGRSATGYDGLFRMTATAEVASTGAFVLPLVERGAFGTTNLTGYDGELIRRRLVNEAMRTTDPAEQRTEYFGVGAALCTVPLVPVAWYRSHLALGPRVLVAGNGGVDRLAGLPELRELALR